MLIAESAVVVSIEYDSPDIQRITVKGDSCSQTERNPVNTTNTANLEPNPQCAAICYPALTGSVSPGQRVILNTTAVRLGLGSGGSHFVIWVEGRNTHRGQLKGNIMKLRYTPLQVACGSAEEHSPYRSAIEAFNGLDGMPVIVCELHSMLAPVAAGMRARTAFIMTDGAALPANMSRILPELVKHGLIMGSISCGQAFGGDLEAVNVHSALVIARQVLKCDAAIVTMGPGIVGTGTKFGNTAIEQGPILDAVTKLGGRAIMVPRLSRMDKRPRHTPVSHHSITVLKDVCCLPCECVVASDMDADFLHSVLNALEPALEAIGHVIRLHPGSHALKTAVSAGLELSTMGRGVEEETEFFLTAAAAGAYARNQGVTGYGDRRS